MDKRELRDIERAGYRTAGLGGKPDPADTIEGSDALDQAKSDREREEITAAFKAGYNRAKSRGYRRNVV